MASVEHDPEGDAIILFCLLGVQARISRMDSDSWPEAKPCFSMR